MRVPVDWLGDYVELPAGVTGARIAADLVRVGLEEEGLHGGDVTGPLVAGRVLEATPESQKNGKTINWCHVDVGPRLNAAHGSEAGIGIVCGAHNFAAGDLVAVILPGGVLPTPHGPMPISARKTYGHRSAGMICSARELGLGDDHEGIIVLDEHLGSVDHGLRPGDDLIPVLGLDREVVEVNVTPDRGYCFSVRGIAREYSHSTGAAFHDPAAAVKVADATTGGFAVELADDAPLRGTPGCDRFVARVVRGIDPAAPTPAWMATRLREAGMRPISLAVDVSNYVMLGLGQPTHAYDLATLTGPIVVRRARPGERLTTLDDVTRALHPEDLLITDGGAGEQGRVLGIAGVMGGASSEVSAATTDVLIEAAHFDPRTVARSSRRHRLSTEASKRFERGVDPALPAVAAQLMVDLLVELGGGTADPESTDTDIRTEGPTIALDTSLPGRYIGVDYSHERVVEVLELIGCEVEDPASGGSGRRPGLLRRAPERPGRLEDGAGTGHAVTVRPPSWRPDLQDGPDLVEEVARIDGYDAIPSIVPAAPGGRGLTHGQRVRRRVADVLAGQGLHEVLTYPFVGPDRFTELGLPAGDERRYAVRLANPLSDEAPLMRTQLLQTLPEALRRNIARGQRDVALYELGTITRPTRGAAAPVPGVGALPAPQTLAAIREAVPEQPWHVAMVAAGQVEHAGWWGPGHAVQAGDAVAWAQSLCDLLAVPVTRTMTERAPWHPGRCVQLALPDGDVVGWAGELHPKVVQALGLPERSVAAELDLEVLIRASDRRVLATPISTHPAATSDVALVVSRSVRFADLEASLRAGAGQLLESILLFDVYHGDQLAEDEQSLAFRMTFRAPDRTLRTEEVNAARDAAVARARADHGAVQR
ncbi:phenylalanine--tRNA ligase subunit beta [Ornithinicoccus halotolerans]|uniref:phenylalanine--tRNA ligase subunit beta n=1 Tax=Ornithinicoccus halotolerans TaxID=1748220 RepID=UPI001295D3EE|nr:phenylalanine--tRNA ligase subunit beta [Ornithinicoccus halotolerans]